VNNVVARKIRTECALAIVLAAVLLVAGSGQALAKDNAPALDMSQRVNVNKASVEELETVTGIGPVIAQRIVEYRDANGAFHSLDDLAQVKGIGVAKYEKMREQLTL
jgi:competence protein ComEA